MKTINRLFTLLLTMMVGLLLFVASPAKAVNKFYEFTFYAKTAHLENVDYRYNTHHKFVGLEYRDNDYGIGASTFKNSFYRRSILIDVAKYWHPTKNLETSLRLGYITGYTKTKVAAIASIAYSGFDRLKPKVSLIGTALVLTISYKF